MKVINIHRFCHNSLMNTKQDKQKQNHTTSGKQSMVPQWLNQILKNIDW